MSPLNRSLDQDTFDSPRPEYAPAWELIGGPEGVLTHPGSLSWYRSSKHSKPARKPCQEEGEASPSCPSSPSSRGLRVLGGPESGRKEMAKREEVKRPEWRLELEDCATDKTTSHWEVHTTALISPISLISHFSFLMFYFIILMMISLDDWRLNWYNIQSL